MSLSKAKRITIAGILLTGAVGVWGYSQLSKTSPVIVEQPEEVVDERVALQVVDIINQPIEATEFNHLDLIKTREGVGARIIELRNSNQMLIENFIEQNDDINWFNIGDRENAKVNLLRTFVRRNTQNFLQIDIDAIYNELNPILDTIINEIPVNITSMDREERGRTNRILESHLRSIEWFTHSGRSVPKLFMNSIPRGRFIHTTEVAIKDNPEEAIRDYIRVNLPETISYEQIEHFVVFNEEENWTENYSRIINDINGFIEIDVDSMITEFAHELVRAAYNELEVTIPEGTESVGEIVQPLINQKVFDVISENYSIPENITPTNGRNYWGWVFWLFREELRDQVLAPYEEGTYDWAQKEMLLSNLGTNVRIQEREESFSQLVPEVYNSIKEGENEIRQSYGYAWHFYTYLNRESVLRNPTTLHSIDNEEIQATIRSEFDRLRDLNAETIGGEQSIRHRINVNNPFYGSGDTFNSIVRGAVSDTFRNHPKMKEVREKIKLIRDTREMIRDLR